MISLEKIDQRRAAGYVATQKHPQLPLLIHNYTQRCQFDQAWDDVTLSCRGLITDESGAVVCRPFRKFFNVEEHDREGSVLPPINWNQPFYVSEKMDGSLGIVYPTQDGQAIATRGSFVSDQAIAATEILKTKYADWRPVLDRTYLFEIIFPGNRIVVDYGDMRDIVLIDVICTATGTGESRAVIESEADRMGCPVVKSIPISDAAAISKYETGEDNREGIVVRFNDGMRVKIKLAEYKRLHRLITGLNARKIWECLSTGTAIDLERVPDEFFEWAKSVEEGLLHQHQMLGTRAKIKVESAKALLGPSATRKDLALEFVKEPDISGLCFAMLDEKDISQMLWKAIYPEHSVPWKSDEV